MASPYPPATSTSDQELDNRELDNREYLFRLEMLIIDGGHLVLRSYIDQKLTASNISLSACLADEKSTICRLRAFKVLPKEQYELLFPSNGIVSTSDLDMTLIAFLLRNLKFFGLNSKFNWNTVPAPLDTSTVADIRRLKGFRNQISHATTTTGIQHSNFKILWKEIKKILLRINTRLVIPIADLRQTIKNFKLCPIDHITELRVDDEIVKRRKFEKAVDVDLSIVKADNKRLIKEVEEIKTKMAKMENQNIGVGRVFPSADLGDALQEPAHNCPSNWTQVQWVGSGAFGKVFMGFDPDTNSYQAVKIVNLIGQNTEVSKCARALENEISLLRDLHHERIVQYKGCSVDKSRICIFIEYMQGGSILDKINKHGALTEQKAARYTRQVLEGLEFLHENTIVHRDIKGSNLLLGETDNIKLADFGTSKRLETIRSISGLSTFIGTAHWMAPEVIRGQTYGWKVDIWSVGCTVVEMLTKRPPWRDLEVQAAIFKIGNGEYPHYTLPNGLSPSIDEFLRLCFERNASERPSAKHLLKRPFVNR